MAKLRWFLTLAVSASCLLGVPNHVSAQGAYGSWGMLGAGTGSANIECDGCTSGRKLRGPTLLSTVGFMFKPHLGIGLGLDQWWRSPQDSEATSLGAVVLHYYPNIRGRAFVEGGLGYSRAEVWLNDLHTARGRGWGLMTAVGYNVRMYRFHDGDYVTSDLTLTPRVSYAYSSIGALRYGAGRPPFATGWRNQVLSAGLGVGYRFAR